MLVESKSPILPAKFHSDGDGVLVGHRDSAARMVENIARKHGKDFICTREYLDKPHSVEKFAQEELGMDEKAAKDLFSEIWRGTEIYITAMPMPHVVPVMMALFEIYEEKINIVTSGNAEKSEVSREWYKMYLPDFYYSGRVITGSTVGNSNIKGADLKSLAMDESGATRHYDDDPYTVINLGAKRAILVDNFQADNYENSQTKNGNLNALEGFRRVHSVVGPETHMIDIFRFEASNILRGAMPKNANIIYDVLNRME